MLGVGLGGDVRVVVVDEVGVVWKPADGEDGNNNTEHFDYLKGNYVFFMKFLRYYYEILFSIGNLIRKDQEWDFYY